MIDILPLAGMLLTLLLTLIIGGFVLLFPLSRRLGKLLEIRMEERRQALSGEGAAQRGELEALRDVVAALQREVEGLTDRQQFLEGLLEREALPPGTGRAPDPSRRGVDL